MILHEVLSWIKGRGLEQVEFQSDSRWVVEVGSQAKNCAEFGAIVAGCKLIIMSNNFFRIKHVRCDFNNLAHRITRIAKDNQNPYVCMG